MLRKGRDIDRLRDGVGMLQDGGRIIPYEKNVVCGVAMSADLAW